MFGKKCIFSSELLEDAEKGTYKVTDSQLEFKIAYSILEVENVFKYSSDFFMNQDYLRLLEMNPSEGLEFIYIPVYERGQPLGIILCQSLPCKGEEILRVDEKEKGFKAWMKKNLLKSIRFNGLVIGSILLTGEFGFRFRNKDAKESFSILSRVINDAVPIIEQTKNVRFSVRFIKDFPGSVARQSQPLKDCGYNEFTAEPCMTMTIRPDWESFEDYLAAMSSKYRVRAKRAFKAAKEVQRMDLSYEEIISHKDRINELYKMISDSADFNLVKLHPDYFAELKKKFNDDYKLVGYFEGDKLIAFFTTIKNGHETHAHFLGIDKAYNRKYQVYLNILYDIIKISINVNNSQHIDFARTAPEIKSSVGAEPTELFCYIKHRNPLANSVLMRVFKFLETPSDVIYRQPFKEKAGKTDKTPASNEAKSGAKAQG